MTNKQHSFFKSFIIFITCIFLALSMLFLFSPKNTVNASTEQTDSGAFVMTFDITFSGAWSSSFNPMATSVYTNNISPTTLQLHFYRGTVVTYNAVTYSTGGKNSYDMNAYTYASSYTNLVSFPIDDELTPPVSFVGDFWDTGWFSMASTSSSMSNELHNPMRIRYTDNFLNSSDDDFIDCVRFSSSVEFVSGGHRLINSMFFYSKTGTCRVDLMQYWLTNSGVSFNAFTDNTFYFQEYVDLVSIRSYQQGYDLGYAEGSGTVITAGTFFEKVFDILDVKIFGIASLTDLLMIVLGVSLTLAVLKIFAGG